jgi:hypothetical protein
VGHKAGVLAALGDEVVLAGAVVMARAPACAVAAAGPVTAAAESTISAPNEAAIRSRCEAGRVRARGGRFRAATANHPAIRFTV